MRIKLVRNIMIFILIILLILVPNILIINFWRTEKPIQTQKLENFKPTVMSLDITQEEAINIVNKHFNYPYILIKTDLDSSTSGKAIPVLNIIFLEKDLSGWETLSTLTHEICHLKYYTVNETYTEYMTFVELFESKNKFMNLRANYMIHRHCVFKKYVDINYDCSYYILEYLKNKGIILN